MYRLKVVRDQDTAKSCRGRRGGCGVRGNSLAGYGRRGAGVHVQISHKLQKQAIIPLRAKYCLCFLVVSFLLCPVCPHCVFYSRKLENVLRTFWACTLVPYVSVCEVGERLREKLHGRLCGKELNILFQIKGTLWWNTGSIFVRTSWFHAGSVRQKPTEFLNVSCFLFISSLVDKEFIYREQKGSVILRNVETNISTVLIEGKKIVSTLSNDQDNFSFPSCKSIK